MKVLVTGGAGYIGSHTVRELVNLNHEVIVLDSLELGHPQLAQAAGASKLVQGNTADAALLDNLFSQEQIEAVIHFAAYKNAGESVTNPGKYFTNNVAGTQSLLDAMLRHNIKHFIFSSSCAIFGTPQNVPVSETNNFFNPESPYGESKLMAEKVMKWYDVAYGLKSINLRYFNAAGASLDGKLGEDWSVTLNLVPLVMKAALGKAPSVKIFGTDYPTPDGTCIRDYIHVVDLAVAHVRALEYLQEYNQSNQYNLGTGQGSSVKQVIDTTKRISGTDFKVEEVARRPGDPVAIWADSSKAERELMWKAKYDLETIIQTAYEWHKNHPEGY
ncbi:MAG: UDP-glucose 4-epimerase GalE [Chloroflexi bacterium]|nr:UDP-glucose 4-epimerase GalE [Chloroflexota bacterium]OJV89477.1 MAG: UDP-glucose 4-epimerase GalE [Chloroflexi bacterium 54-19]